MISFRFPTAIHVILYCAIHPPKIALILIYLDIFVGSKIAKIAAQSLCEWELYLGVFISFDFFNFLLKPFKKANKARAGKSAINA